MTKVAFAFAAALIAMSTGAAFAADRTGERREANQEHMIENARRSGQLTRAEYQKLQNEQARIDALQRSAKADGRVDRQEAAQIRRAQNEAGRHIYQESHDSQKSRSWLRFW